MRILLVEDEPSAARFIAKGLREAAYAVDIASNGAAASLQSQQNDPFGTAYPSVANCVRLAWMCRC
jgi:DNA-binding response OmpR family regulator